MKLIIRVQGAEPYNLDMHELEHAIEAEADNVLGEANADHLEEPTDECYEALRQKVIKDATRALRDVGDTYVDPIGLTWELIA